MLATETELNAFWLGVVGPPGFTAPNLDKHVATRVLALTVRRRHGGRKLVLQTVIGEPLCHACAGLARAHDWGQTVHVPGDGQRRAAHLRAAVEIGTQSTGLVVFDDGGRAAGEWIDELLAVMRSIGTPHRRCRLLKG